MNAIIFVEWMRRQGYRVVHSPSSYWVELGPHIYQAFPYHWLIQPTYTELQQLMEKSKAIGLRYSTPIEFIEGAISYHVIYEGADFPLESLPKKVRYDIRKGLRYVEIQPISFSRLASEGWQLRYETLERQGRTKAESKDWWINLCTSAKNLPGFEAWGAVSDGELVSSLITFTCDDCCNILHQQSKTAHMVKGVNNAMVYEFTRAVLERSGIQKVFYGLHSLDAPPSVDRFKFRMGFSAKPVRQRVVFHPRLEPFFNRTSHAILTQLLRFKPVHPTLAKAEGMIRFYLKGKKSLKNQIWPLPLEGSRAEVETSLISS